MHTPLLALAYGGHGIVDELVARPWVHPSERIQVLFQPDMAMHLSSALFRLQEGLPDAPIPLDKPWTELSAGDCLAAAVTPGYIHNTLLFEMVGDPYAYAELLCAIAAAEAVRKKSGVPIFIDPLSGYGIPEHQPTAPEQHLALIKIGSGGSATTTWALLQDQASPAVLRGR